jgi:hypothetical protein
MFRAQPLLMVEVSFYFLEVPDSFPNLNINKNGGISLVKLPSCDLL